MINLRKNSIKNDFIEVVTIKTRSSLRIDLNRPSREIIAKYINLPTEKNTLFPFVSNSLLNEKLKELGKAMGLDQLVRITYFVGAKRVDKDFPKYALLTSHAGRRTFICNALSLGIPPQVVMKWTGHSDYNAMKPYIDIADEIKANAMKKFDNL